MIIQNGLVYTNKHEFLAKDIQICGSQIEIVSDMISAQSKDCIDASNCYIIPGLIDLHFHGCVGHDFSDGSIDAIEKILHYEISHGITSVCPATMTLPSEDISRICQTAFDYREQKKSLWNCLVGINLEGPFLSKEKKGAQKADYLQNPDASLLDLWNQKSGGLVKLVSIAPELCGAMDCIRESCHNYRISLAHTNADYDIALEAFQNGASHVTHLYNAMPPFTHRAPGVIGAAFDTPYAEVELICDGIHISPCVVRATFQLFGSNRVILISDSMRAAGMPDGSYSLGGQPVTVKDKLATLADGTIAGSASNLFDCMCQAIQMGIPKEAAIAAATENPARSLGIFQQVGSIEAKKQADLLLVDKTFHLRQVIKNGQLI